MESILIQLSLSLIGTVVIARIAYKARKSSDRMKLYEDLPKIQEDAHGSVKILRDWHNKLGELHRLSSLYTYDGALIDDLTTSFNRLGSEVRLTSLSRDLRHRVNVNFISPTIVSRVRKKSNKLCARMEEVNEKLFSTAEHNVGLIRTCALSTNEHNTDHLFFDPATRWLSNFPQNAQSFSLFSKGELSRYELEIDSLMRELRDAVRSASESIW